MHMAICYPVHVFTYMYLQEELKSVRCVRWEGDIVRGEDELLRRKSQVVR